MTEFLRLQSEYLDANKQHIDGFVQRIEAATTVNRPDVVVLGFTGSFVGEASGELTAADFIDYDTETAEDLAEIENETLRRLAGIALIGLQGAYMQLKIVSEYCDDPDNSKPVTAETYQALIDQSTSRYRAFFDQTSDGRRVQLSFMTSLFDGSELRAAELELTEGDVTENLHVMQINGVACDVRHKFSSTGVPVVARCLNLLPEGDGPLLVSKLTIPMSGTYQTEDELDAMLAGIAQPYSGTHLEDAVADIIREARQIALLANENHTLTRTFDLSLPSVEKIQELSGLVAD